MFKISGKKMRKYGACADITAQVLEALDIKGTQEFTLEEFAKLVSSVPDIKDYCSACTPLDFMFWYLIKNSGEKVWGEIKEDWKRLTKKYAKQIIWEDYTDEFCCYPRILERLEAIKMLAYVMKRA